MSNKRKILIQLDTDERPSSFDAVVAVDSGAEVLLPYAGVTPSGVRDIVYGAMFTRGVDDLRSTAIFVGGSDVALGEEVLAAVRGTFFGPLTVSCMLDSGGANTTASAAVIAALRSHGGEDLTGARALVLGSTGPVGRRVAHLLAICGADVVASSRSKERADSVVDAVRSAVEGASVSAVAVDSESALDTALEGCRIVVAAGGPGVRLLPESVRRRASSLLVAIDLNAVPPLGIEGVGTHDTGKDLDGVAGWGAIGVGGIKMKIHKACVASLFTAKDRVLDAEQILSLARSVAR